MAGRGGEVELEDIKLEAVEESRAMTAIGYDGYDIEAIEARRTSRTGKIVSFVLYVGMNLCVYDALSAVHTPRHMQRLVIMMAISVFLFAVAQWSNPGWVPPPGRDSPPLLSDYENRREAAAAATAAIGAGSTGEIFSNILPWPEWPPMRAAYCKVTKRWIYTYDHYCPLLGTPIGERNRGRFWMFLLAQTVALGQAAALAETTVRWEDIFKGVEVPLFACLALWITFLSIAVFFLFHTFLALTNMTSNEFLRAATLDYLHNTEDFDLPFSRGPCANLYLFFSQDGLFWWCHKWKPIPWVRAAFINRNAADWWNHPWQNKYWSCC